jgi:tetratricopeptide (TPR) repeat protein
VNLATAYSALRKDEQALKHYQRAFDLSPSLRTDLIVNHEYGFLLARTGDFDGAAAHFSRMLSEKSTGSQARGHRSLGLLETFRGRHDAGIEHFRQAVVINQTNKARLSEFRDRLYLARAYRAKKMAQPFGAELDAAQQLAVASRLAPEWLKSLGKVQARAGRTAQARTTLTLMSKTAGDATAAASVNRNAAAEQAHFDIVRGEIELAEGRAAKAVEYFQAAYVIDPSTETLDSLSMGLLAAGAVEEAGKRFEALLARREFGNESQEPSLNAQVRLAEIYVRLGRIAEARTLCEEFLERWKAADDDLVLLGDARKVLASLK